MRFEAFDAAKNSLMQREYYSVGGGFVVSEEVAADARRNGATVSIFAQVETPERPEVDMRRHAMKRALANLVENGSRYADTVSLSVRITRKFTEFVVEDDGP